MTNSAWRSSVDKRYGIHELSRQFTKEKLLALSQEKALVLERPSPPVLLVVNNKLSFYQRLIQFYPPASSARFIDYFFKSRLFYPVDLKAAKERQINALPWLKNHLIWHSSLKLEC